MIRLVAAQNVLLTGIVQQRMTKVEEDQKQMRQDVTARWIEFTKQQQDLETSMEFLEMMRQKSRWW